MSRKWIADRAAVDADVDGILPGASGRVHPLDTLLILCLIGMNMRAEG